MDEPVNVAELVNKLAATRKKSTRSTTSYGANNGNVTKTFRAATSLTNGEKTFEVPAGAEITVFGPMGSGSNIVATVTDPSSGNIVIKANGKMLRRAPDPNAVRSTSLLETTTYA